MNLSGDSLHDADLPAFVESELERASVDPGDLIFEVTETAAIANIAQARDSFIERLEFGCSFALDDFGAGFGSYYYLKHLPLDYLKIDGEFVRNLPNSHTDQVLVRSWWRSPAASAKEYCRVRGGRGDRRRAEGARRGLRPGFHTGRPRPVAECLTSLTYR